MKNFDKIDKYLKGKMDSAEERVFEKSLKDNEELAVEFELQKQENLAIRNIAFNMLKKNIKALDLNGGDDINEVEPNSGINEQKKGSNLFVITLSIIALFILGLLLYNWSYNMNGTEEKEKPIEKIENTTQKQNTTQEKIKITAPIKESKPEIIRPEEKPNSVKRLKNSPSETIDYKLIAAANLPKNINTRGNEDFVGGPNSEWNSINEFIKQNELDKALELINNLNKDNGYYLDARLLKAQTYLRTNRFSEAASEYRYLIKEGDAFIMDTYQYELLLSLLGQLPETSAIFKKMLKELENNPDFTYQENISKIKIDLKKVNFE